MEKQTVVIEYYVNTQYWLDAYYAIIWRIRP